MLHGKLVVKWVTLLTSITVMEVTFIEYCFADGTWRVICDHPNTWTQSAAVVVCKQLGYSDKGVTYGLGCYGNRARASIQLVKQCNGTEGHISECGEGVLGCQNCRCSDHAWVTCQPADCTNGEIRLVNGSTNREGRVEVCMDGSWGTVCNNQEGLAGAICAQLGFPAEEAYAITNYGPGILSLPIASCSLQSESNLSCTQITDASCDHIMDLGVVCQQTTSSPDDDKDCPTVTLPEESTEQSNTNEGSGTQSGSTVAYETVVGILVVLQVITLTGWIVTCFGKRLMTFIRKSATVTAEVTTSRNESYDLQRFNTATPTQATPTEDDYSTLQGPTYDFIDDAVPEYDVIDHNHYKPPTRGQ